jgi:hypothetical protein
MSSTRKAKRNRFMTFAALLLVANILGGYGYTPAAGLRWAWRKVDHGVTHTLALVP